MTRLSFGTWTMPGAELGPDNPLPSLHAPPSVIEGVRVEDSVEPADRAFLGYGLDAGVLPYGLQDQYDRELEPRPFRTATLENEYLKAVFLTELGGRLWSLFDKRRQRELLYRNPVFRVGNLAVRNAWFSGGVEWNPSVRGHSPFTCSPLFVAALRTAGGDPVLRMYEWERIRGVPFQMDFLLPADSPFLFVHVRLINPHRATVPMYWWSNIAVPEDPACRVLTPASGAYRFTYRSGRKRMGNLFLSEPGEPDVTYAVRSSAAADYFFRIGETPRPWIAALDQTGYGLIQLSTPELRGRKLFVWGMGVGGRRWQEFLSTPGHPYIEIQAGLARTQMECLPMPARSEWSWMEAYGPMQADPARSHGDDWPQAWRHVESCAREALPCATIHALRSVLRETADQPVGALVQRGSGWGALERHQREAAGEEPMSPDSMAFDDASLAEAQLPWLELLRHGRFPSAQPARPVSGWMIQEEFRTLLERAARTRGADHWLGWLHLGVMRYAEKDLVGAREAWERSIEREPNTWAYRNLAVLATDEGRLEDAADLMEAAWRLLPGLSPLAEEYGRALTRAERYREAADWIDGLPEALRSDVRIQALRALAALHVGDLTAVEQFLNSGAELPSLREGELSLTELWFELQARRLAEQEGMALDDRLREQVRRTCPPPPGIDFRMFESCEAPASVPTGPEP